MEAFPHSTELKFTPFQWAVTPQDPNDRLLGQLIAESSSGTEGDVVLFGLPFDGAVLGRRGAAAGPAAIRAQARKLKSYSYIFGALQRRVLDLGDVNMLPDDVPLAHLCAERAARFALSRLRQHKQKHTHRRVVALGGDHSLTYACALPYLEKHGDRLAVINLDAHLDVRQVPNGQMQNSGTSFGRLLVGGLRSYTAIGVRDFQTSAAYVRRMNESRGRVVPASEVFESGAIRTAKAALRALPKKCEAIYLSVDIDVADASVAPGASAATPGGLLAHQVFELVRTLAADPRTVACDIMELAPALEEPGSDRTARLAAGCLAEMLY